MDQWSNKVAIVTAASSEIGAEVCRELCSHGLTVIGLTPHIDQLDDLGEEIHSSNTEGAQFHAVQCDMVHEEEIKNAFEYICGEFGGVDVLVNTTDHEQEDVTLQSAESLIRRNILGLISIAKKAQQSMVDRDSSGFIINITPTIDGGRPSAIWTAINAFNCAFGVELCAQEQPKIRVTNITPSNVKLDSGEGTSGVVDGHFIGPKDIAQTVIYCLSTPAHVQVKEISIGATGGII